MDTGSPSELVQLLTPEGERVHHPDYDVDLTDARLPRRCTATSSLVRRVDLEATALQRQGELGPVGQPARPGGRAGRVRPGAGAGRLRVPDLPRARRRARPAASTRSSLLGLFRGVTNGGWDPQRAQLRALHDRHRQPVPARGRLRDGRADGRGRPGDADRTPARSSRTSATARPARATSTRRSSSRRRSTPRSCSSARTTSGRSPSRWRSRPGSRCTGARAGFGFPGVRVDGNDVLAVLAVTQAAPRSGARGQGPDADRGVHLPDGRAHDVRRPDPLPAGQRPRGLEAQGPDRAGAVVPVAPAAGRPGVLRRASRPRPRRWPYGCARAAARCPTRSRDAMFDEVYAEPHPLVERGARGLRGVPRVLRGRAGATAAQALMPETRHAWPVRSTSACAVRWRTDDQRRAHGRGHRQARRRLPGHRRAAEGLRRAPGHRHPARRERHRRHRRRPGDARLPAGRRDPVRRVRLPGVRPDRVAGGQAARPLARRPADADVDPDPVRRRHRRGRAPQREPGGVLRAHRGAARRDARPTRSTRTG